MKIKEYLANPVGKGSAIYPVRDMAKKMNDKYILREPRIKHKIYDVKNAIYFQFQIPSEIEEIYYDVIIAFKDTEQAGGVSILDMDFQVFSNCPSFVYTFCYSYNKRGLVLTDMQRNRTVKAIVESADTRNPYNLIGYEYSVYMALKYIIAHKLTNLDNLKKRAVKTITINKLIDNIQDFDSLMLRRDAKSKHDKELKKRESKKLRVSTNQEMKNLAETDGHAAETVGTTARTQTIGNIQRNKRGTTIKNAMKSKKVKKK